MNKTICSKIPLFDICPNETNIENNQTKKHVYTSIHSNTIYSRHLMAAILTCVKWHHVVALICISLIMNDVEHLLICLSAIYISALGNVCLLL